MTSSAHQFDPEGTVHQKGRHGEAFNAEPEPNNLTSSLITGQKELYRRNHDDIIYQPNIESKDTSVASEWLLDITVDADVAQEQGWQNWQPVSDGAAAGVLAAASKSMSISVADLKRRFQQRRVIAAMECAGNRRSDMNERGIRKTEGLQWNQGTIGNALWKGASVREVLLNHGIPDPYAHLGKEEANVLAPTAKSIEEESAAWSRELYLHFISSQPTSESKSPAGEVYGSSISLATALHPNQDVLLSWGVDEESLDSTHGYPLRAVIPGHVAARWTKWLSQLRISKAENQSPPMVADYKILKPPEGVSEQEQAAWLDKMTGEGKDEEAREKELKKLKPMMRLGVGSGVSEPIDDEEVELLQGEKLCAQGYAVGTEGSPVTLIELLLLPDPSTSAEDDSTEQLRQSASKVCSDQWYRLELNESNTRSVYPKKRKPIGTGVPPEQKQQRPSHNDDQLEVAEVESARAKYVGQSVFSWSWTLWRAEMPLSDKVKEELSKKPEIKWALLVRGTTASGIQQEVQSPWNIRGFRERSWPVVAGLTFSASP